MQDIKIKYHFHAGPMSPPRKLCTKNGVILFFRSPTVTTVFIVLSKQTLQSNV